VWAAERAALMRVVSPLRHSSSSQARLGSSEIRGVKWITNPLPNNGRNICEPSLPHSLFSRQARENCFGLRVFSYAFHLAFKKNCEKCFISTPCLILPMLSESICTSSTSVIVGSENAQWRRPRRFESARAQPSKFICECECECEFGCECFWCWWWCGGGSGRLCTGQNITVCRRRRRRRRAIAAIFPIRLLILLIIILALVRIRSAVAHPFLDVVAFARCRSGK
jgi:hypothetical protein